MALADPNALKVRARALAAKGLNGMRLVQVFPDNVNNRARLDVQFHNGTATAGFQPIDFAISGGQRVLAGSAVGQVQVTAVATDADATILHLTVQPIGDYSTYTLCMPRPSGSASANVIDPIFDELDFKFRPACFSIDCAPDWTPAPPPVVNPKIDYLAKDYDSFRHTLITAMQARVSGFVPTSEADLTEVLIDLFSAAADELSDYQDRVMNEAYFMSARKRVSLARYARLMDYHIYQGNQASTWLAIEAKAQVPIPAGYPLAVPIPSPPGSPPAGAPSSTGLVVWTGPSQLDPAAICFSSLATVAIDPAVNDLTLYTWSGTEPALATGDTSADLRPAAAPLTTQAAADQLAALFNGTRAPSATTKQVQWLLIQEHLNPITGQEADFDRTKRQLLQLLDGTAAKSVLDPLTGEYAVRVHWEPADALLRDYCFVTDPPDGGPPVPDVSLFHGNLVQIYQGATLPPPTQLLPQPVPPQPQVFRPPGAALNPGEKCWTDSGIGAECVLDPTLPVLYQTTPRSEAPTATTLYVEVQTPGQLPVIWQEDINFIHAQDDDQQFIVETDELQRSVVRFGNGTNGAQLPDDAIVQVQYQSGRGGDGNVGADTITGCADPNIASVWNPFDVTNGADPEPVAEIIRNVPEAFRAVQLRAITLNDYVRRAEELAGVQEAGAAYGWTGSWRTVRITVDPGGTETLSPALIAQLQSYIDSVRLLGEDIEIRPPRFVPLVIKVQLCIDPDFWPEDVQSVLEQEFSTGFTPNGRKGFFNPDNWTFGQQLYASEIEGRVQSVAGVEHIISLTVQRWNAPAAGDRDFTSVGPDEIIRVDNNPDAMERGSITFTTFGGRQ